MIFVYQVFFEKHPPPQQRSNGPSLIGSKASIKTQIVKEDEMGGMSAGLKKLVNHMETMSQKIKGKKQGPSHCYW